MNKAINLFKRHGLFLSLVLLLIITVLSLIPGENIPSMSGSDKVRHALAYCCIAFPIAFLRPANWVWLLVGVFVWSGLIELLQPFSNRYAEWLDLLANGVGVFLAYVLSMALLKTRLGDFLK